jgi:3'-phosphoadenosine 5'-phosphosulfate sulfotransferase (PAPS reductase)/FAD synthetase
MNPIHDPVEALRMVKDLVRRGALFVVSHSGGKDSQAMLIVVRKLVPDSQILVVHADLGEVEWPGTLEHAAQTSKGLPFVVCRAGKNLLGMVKQRGMWPSPKYRQCTSDLKRGPITKTIRAYAKERGRSLIVEAWGLRAQESGGRAGKPLLEQPPDKNKANWEWYVWLPIHRMTVDQVWNTIHAAGQKGHWAYGKGMSRLSCSFCIMSNKSDLAIAALERPELFAKYEALEKEIGHTVFTRTVKGKIIPVPLREHIGLSPETPKRRLPILESLAATAPRRGPDESLARVRLRAPRGVISADELVRQALEKYR